MDFDNSKHPKQPSVVPNRLRTFGGVFTPSILTILGVIMFLGAGFVIGQAGIFYALLILFLAHLLTLNWDWMDSKIRLLRLVQDEAGGEPSANALREPFDAARLNAQVSVLVSTAPFAKVMQRHSGDATVVFLGFNVPEEQEGRQFQHRFEEMMSGLPTTLLICSSGEADLLA
jgi:hypothetical protein